MRVSIGLKILWKPFKEILNPMSDKKMVCAFA